MSGNAEVLVRGGIFVCVSESTYLSFLVSSTCFPTVLLCVREYFI